MTETRQLICEGSCNPQLRVLDEQRIAATIKWRPERVQMPSMPDGWVDAARTLVHTRHRRSGATLQGQTWECSVCGQTRRF